MRTIDLICETCGEANPAGTEFCRNCNAFLAWDRTKLAQDAPPARPPAWPVSAASVPVVPSAGRVVPPVPAPPSGGQLPPPRPTPQPAAPFPYPSAPPSGAYVPRPDLNTFPQGGRTQGGAIATASAVCPQCGQVNPRSRRFCSRCGYGFAAQAPDAGRAASSVNTAAADRAARREFRRSLPAFYRWRRVVIGVLVAGLVTGAAVVLSRDPVGLGKDAWYGLTRQYTVISPVAAAVDPASAAAPKSDPAKLVDGTVEEFSMVWEPSGTSACGAAPGTGSIVLTIAPTRIRQVVLYPGLDKDNSQRALQPLPKSVGISFDGGPCQRFELGPVPGPIPVDVDSGGLVTQVRIGITDSYPAGADAQHLISFSEIVLKAFPN